MIDWARVNELREEIGEEDFAEVLDLFLEEIEETVDGLEPSGAPPKLAADLHGIKGAARNIGFSELAKLCESAEGGAATDDIKPRLKACLAQSKEKILADTPA